MLKYWITIVDTTTKRVSHLERDTTTIEATIQKELGGWNNYHAMTSGHGLLHPDGYCMSGVSKDGSKQFSILCNEDGEPMV